MWRCANRRGGLSRKYFSAMRKKRWRHVGREFVFSTLFAYTVHLGTSVEQEDVALAIERKMIFKKSFFLDIFYNSALRELRNMIICEHNGWCKKQLTRETLTRLTIMLQLPLCSGDSVTRKYTRPLVDLHHNDGFWSATVGRL